MTRATFSASAMTEVGNPGGASFFSFSIDNISAAIPASPASGNIQFTGPTTGQQLVSGTCDFYFKNPGASTEGVADGNLVRLYLPESHHKRWRRSGRVPITESFVAYRNCALGVEL